MSQTEQNSQLPEVTYDQSLSVIYDSITVLKPQLASVVKWAGIEDPENHHIHITPKPLYNPTDGVLVGQCAKINPNDSEQVLQSRKRYISWLIPDVDTAKIPETTYTFVDVAQIAIESLGTVLNRRKPKVHEFETEVCKVASKVLVHELIHASITMTKDDDHNDDLKGDEEQHVEDTLSKAKIPPRLINARLDKAKSISDYKDLMIALHMQRSGGR